MIQDLAIDVPVLLVEQIETAKQGLLKNEDHIRIHFQSGAPIQMAHFHIWQNNTTWQQLIYRVKNRDFDQDRIVPLDPSADEKVKAAPTKCPSCGGTITTPVLRGMDSVICSYCGTVIRF